MSISLNVFSETHQGRSIRHVNNIATVCRHRRIGMKVAHVEQCGFSLHARSRLLLPIAGHEDAIDFQRRLDSWYHFSWLFTRFRRIAGKREGNVRGGVIRLQSISVGSSGT